MDDALWLQVGADGEGPNCLVSVGCHHSSSSCWADWQVSFWGRQFWVKFWWIFAAFFLHQFFWWSIIVVTQSLLFTNHQSPSIFHLHYHHLHHQVELSTEVHVLGSLPEHLPDQAPWHPLQVALHPILLHSPGRFQYSWCFTILNLFSSGSQLRSKELQEETSAVRLFDF